MIFFKFGFYRKSLFKIPLLPLGLRGIFYYILLIINKNLS